MGRVYLKYLVYVLRHKWFVFWECMRLGVPLWRAIKHDWHKFLPDEFIPYARYFYREVKEQIRNETGYYKPTDTGYAPFDWAWFLHQKRADHHWQWWVLPEDGSGIKILPMSEQARLEMLADWRGAGRAQGTPDTKAWYLENGHKLQLNPETRAWVEVELGVDTPAQKPPFSGKEPEKALWKEWLPTPAEVERLAGRDEL